MIFFYPRSPCGGPRQKNIYSRTNHIFSIHALLAESDQPRKTEVPGAIVFLSTLSLRRATYAPSRRPCRCNFSIHALLAESDHVISQRIGVRVNFSIHALLAESDTGGQSCNSTLVLFYPRSPCGERPVTSIFIVLPLPFLSTLSLRRATYVSYNQYNNTNLFYPRSPCGERQQIAHQ